MRFGTLAYATAVFLFSQTILHAANSGRTEAVLDEMRAAPSSWTEWRPNTGHVYAHNPVITKWRPGKLVLTFYYAVYEESENQDLFVACKHGSEWSEPYELARAKHNI
ncbi:MAG: hypothetical protein GF350_08330 [Chitinivibrionales bacterium]|nr:hypothetical protein [Chitinivibrionales bacterium]